MLTANEFSTLANAVGIQMTWTQAKAPQQTAVIQKAILQSTAKSQEAIVNAYGVNGTSIQLLASALPIEPEKFDVFTKATGEKYVIDTVVPHHERGTGTLIYYTCYSKGK